MTTTAHPALVLNADFRPMSYFPLSLLSWQDAISAVFSHRVSVVAEYDACARSPSTRIRLPSVVALRKYQRPPRRVVRAACPSPSRSWLSTRRACWHLPSVASPSLLLHARASVDHSRIHAVPPAGRDRPEPTSALSRRHRIP